MKNSKQFFYYFVIIVLSSFIIPCLSFAQTHIPYGDVSGIWTIDGSPYIIDGHISVPVDSTLIIEPGVNIFFPEQNHFRVYGRLLAIGTESDTIGFTASDTTDTFAGLYFCETNTSFQDSSKLKHCRFDPGCVGFSNSSRAVVKNCIVTNGYGIGFNNSSPTILDVTISNNTSESYGGGIYCTDSSNPSVTNVTVSGNSATWGGGISCRFNSNPTLENISIVNNIAIGAGGGIFCEESTPVLTDINIIENYVSNGIGGGIYCDDNSNPDISNVNIENNFAYWGGGIGCTNSSPILNNVMIIGNSGGGIYSEGTGNILLQDFIITGNNNAQGFGGGVSILGADMIMVNGIVADNYADDAGGIFCHNGVNLSLTNVTVSVNSVDAGGIVGGIGCEFDCILNITNSIVWNNDPMDIFLYGFGCESDITYSDIGGSGGQGVGNINTNPLFADTLYHLSEDSPCIDAGNPDTMYYDVEDSNNPGFAFYPAMGTLHNDIGAYGGHGKYEPILSTDDPPHSQSMTINNYPNPFTSSTIIQYTLPQNTREAHIEIYNIKGQLVRELKIENLKLKINEVIWDGKDDKDRMLPSGVYLYKINFKNSPLKKITLIK